MTDTHEDVPERKDPVLVRPYIGASSGAEPSTEEPETWPETATLPEPTLEPASLADDEAEAAGDAEASADPAAVAEPGPADTAVLPPVPAGPEIPADPVVARRGGLSLAQRLLILCGGVALALGVVAYLVLGTGGDSGRQPGAALPAYTGGVPTAGATGAPRPSSSVSSSASPSPSASASSSASASVSASASAGVSPSISAPAAVVTSVSAAPTTPAAPTLDPAPGADRTGPITAASGRCLNLGGLLGIDGSPVQVAGCTGGTAQRFTLATDGTLRVGTRCAQTTGDGSVRVTGCDDRASAQWRGGPGGTLVNPASGQCLTDPGRTGATTTAAACAGGADQTWALP
jgi:ricin-type beta-trefoil lectin protein